MFILFLFVVIMEYSNIYSIDIGLLSVHTHTLHIMMMNVYRTAMPTLWSYVAVEAGWPAPISFAVFL
jgi:hypothetical protein